MGRILTSLILLALSALTVLRAADTSSLFNRKPKQFINAVGHGFRFGGVSTSARAANEEDHFKLLEVYGDSLMVGARNAVYNISLSNLGVNHKIDWKPPAGVIEECMMKGKTKSDCQNYVRVLARQSAGSALVCGTHAFSPKCREYVYDPRENQLKNKRQFDGIGISPYDPRDNSTALFVAATNEIFTGTVSDFVSGDPLIYKKRIDNDRDPGLRTQKDDGRVLDSPNFVGSFLYKEHVYFWYRERAAEAVDNNEERQVYARVGRVCRGDRGGARPMHERWTSFIKARLNCSLGANGAPFYFNEIKAVSDPVPATNDHLVYAVFSTPEGRLRMSAVCAFSMKKVRDAFDHGTFKHQKTPSSLWTPFSMSEVPRPRPGGCVPDSTMLSANTIVFTSRNPLLYKPVQSIGGPIIVEGSDKPELTQIAVLPGVKSVAGQTYDVLYLGTGDGKVLKLVDAGSNSALVESISIFAANVPVVNLLTNENRLIVVSSDEIASIEVQNCDKQTSCSRCVGLRDPHCAWDTASARCLNKADWSKGSTYIQNIVFGHSEQCPEGVIVHDGYPDDDPQPVMSSVSVGGGLSAQRTALVAVVVAVIALVLGTIFGYQVGRSRALAEQHHSASSTSGSDYDAFGRARLTRHDSLTSASNRLDQQYVHKPTADGASLVLSLPPGMSTSQHGSGINTPSRDKNAVLTSINQNTLPRDYKVKKVYL